MPLPKEFLDTIAEDIGKAETSLADLKDVVSDMRLAGMDTAKQEAVVEELTKKLRTLRVFYDISKAKAS